MDPIFKSCPSPRAFGLSSLVKLPTLDTPTVCSLCAPPRQPRAGGKSLTTGQADWHHHKFFTGKPRALSPTAQSLFFQCFSAEDSLVPKTILNCSVPKPPTASPSPNSPSDLASDIARRHGTAPLSASHHQARKLLHLQTIPSFLPFQ